MNTEYYAVVEDLDYVPLIVWGTGESKEEAEKDAEHWITRWVADNSEETPPVTETLPMSEEAYESYAADACEISEGVVIVQ